MIITKLDYVLCVINLMCNQYIISDEMPIDRILHTLKNNITSADRAFFIIKLNRFSIIS